MQNKVGVCKQAPVPFPKGRKSRGDGYGNGGLQRLGEAKREEVERERKREGERQRERVWLPSSSHLPSHLPFLHKSLPNVTIGGYLFIF